MYYIYRHIVPDGLSYIGKTSNLKKRFRNGLGYKECTKFYKAIKKYGWENIEHEILYITNNEINARKLEKEMINKYNSIDNGYNSNNRLEARKSETSLKKYKQYDLNGNIIKIFNNSKELREEGFNPDNIRACCRGKVKTSQNYIWKYTEI